MSLHVERWETGVRLHGATLKRTNTSMASFLDSQLMLQSVLRAAHHVTVLNRTTEQYGRAVDKMNMGAIFEKTGPFVVLSCPCVCGLLLSNRDWSQRGGLPSCLLRFMTLIWTLQSSEQEHSLATITAYLHLQHIGLLPWMMLAVLWIWGTRKGKVIRQKIMIMRQKRWPFLSIAGH